MCVLDLKKKKSGLYFFLPNFMIHWLHKSINQASWFSCSRNRLQCPLLKSFECIFWSFRGRGEKSLGSMESQDFTSGFISNQRKIESKASLCVMYGTPQRLFQPYENLNLLSSFSKQRQDVWILYQFAPLANDKRLTFIRVLCPIPFQKIWLLGLLIALATELGN